jgi:hypothetical protein
MAIWSIVNLTTCISPPRTTSQMLGGWLEGYNDHKKDIILVEGAAL